jgi:hypothetical protein
MTMRDGGGTTNNNNISSNNGKIATNSTMGTINTHAINTLSSLGLIGNISFWIKWGTKGCSRH